MADTTGERVACQYCGTDIQVPAERSRFEVSIAHFEAVHVTREGPPAGTDERAEAIGEAWPVTGEGGEEMGISD